MRSASVKYGSMARGPVASSPRLRSQCSSTRSGVRHVMPPLMTVDPPTHFPSAKMMPGLPKIIVVPASRYRRWIMVAGSVVNVSVRWSPPSSRISTSRPASRSRAAAVAPPAPLPTTIASALNSRSPSSAAPTMTFGYSIRCSGGTSRSAGTPMDELRPPRDERRRTAGPVDVEGGEDVGMLIESEEDERAEAEEECAAEAGCVPPAGEVAPSLLGRHRAETAQPAREEWRTVLDQVEAERQADAQRPGQVGQEAPDVSQHVLVDRLVEAVSARPDGGDDGTEDAGLRARERSGLEGQREPSS